MGERQTTLTREELHALVWSRPMRTLAPDFGISDVGLRKICVSAGIPLPGAGYWAKKAHGKRVKEVPLPKRPPGMDETVTIGRRRYWYWITPLSDEELLGPLPPCPTFSEPIDSVRAQALKDIGRVAVPRDLSRQHPAIRKLLEDDEVRRAEAVEKWWVPDSRTPLPDTPLYRRGLRLINGLFHAVARADGQGTVRHRDGEFLDFSVVVHDQSVTISLEPLTREKNASSRRSSSKKKQELRLSLPSRSVEEASWSDGDGVRIESRLREIAAEIVTTAEIQYRDGRTRSWEWRVERKAELEEKIRKQKEEEERRRREAEAALEKAKVDRLLGEAEALRKANDIRAYVAAVEALTAATPMGDSQAFLEWREWAVAQADHLDPVLSGRFLTGIPAVAPA